MKRCNNNLRYDKIEFQIIGEPPEAAVEISAEKIIFPNQQ
jgi:hypothetical protein